MEIKTVGVDDIAVGDEVRFLLETHDGDGCPKDPYQITDVKIYFITREFTDSTVSEYQIDSFNPELEEEYKRIKRLVCIKAKDMVKAASVSNLTLSGLQTIDGVALSEGDRVLVKNQNTGSNNGIYLASSEEWKRSSDSDSNEKVESGMYVFVENGISNSGTGWVLEVPNRVEIDSTSLNFLLFARDFTPDSPDAQDRENTRVLDELKIQMEASKTKSPFFYKDAITVRKFGGENDSSSGEFFPAWLNPDRVLPELKSKIISDNILQKAENDSGEVPGLFVLDWSTLGMREGDYFICWTWRPTMSDETLSAHEMFHLSGNSETTSSIPTHNVNPEKYDILLDRYTPEMFKTRISDADLSPEVMSEFNKAVAKGFMFVENQAASVIDLLDANSIHEQLLPLLSNMFNLKVKSSDPTLWRRQIKKAIPNFKKKGSIAGLREAMKDAGMKLIRLARMWQVIPRYTHQEHFTYEKPEFSSSSSSSNPKFQLSFAPIVPLDTNFRLWFRGKDQEKWTELVASNSSSSSSAHWSGAFVAVSGSVLTWTGPELSEGDSIRVLYKFRNIPAGEQAKEDYIRSLPLMDDRDERDQEYPPKNWNVHLIEEDDENFGVLIPVRHPLSDPIVWGRIRTEFPYSENVYNMEEYNGSRRDSFNPCDIDKSFMDRCGQCASSKFNMDLEVERLSDESIKEARQIVEEYMPFHAVANSFNLWGGTNEFIRHNEEKIEALISFSREDILLAGEGQQIFSRAVYNSDIDSVRRNVLASMQTINSPSSGTTNWSGTIKNTRTLLLSSVTLDSSDVFGSSLDGKLPGFNSLNVDVQITSSDPFENGNLLEILGSSIYRYSISSIDNSVAVIHGTISPSLVGPIFEYRISNKISDLNVNISQYEEIIFNDDDVDFSILGIVSQHDVDLGLASGVAWRLIFAGKEYLVRNILPDGSLLLSELSSVSSVPGWKLISGSSVKKEGINGQKTESGYGLVSVNSPSSFVTRQKLKIGDYIYMNWGSSLRTYKIRSFQKDTENFYISNYNEGNIGGEDIKVYRRIMDNKIGQFGYDSPVIVTTDNLQTALGISTVDSSKIIENYMLFIDGEYYTISGLDGHNVMLSGPPISANTTGVSASFNVYKFIKENLTLHEKQNPPYKEALKEHKFNYVDRSGGFILSNTEGANSLNALSSLLNSSEPTDVMSHDERIEFSIEYKEETK